MATLLAAPVRAATGKYHYMGYAAGLPVLDIVLSLAIDAAGYNVDMTLRTVGVLTVFVDGDAHAVARGHWEGRAPIPELYDSRGHLNGEARQTTIDYAAGHPAIRALIPANEAEREPVPATLQANTLDSLAAMVAVLRIVSETRRCDDRARIFDGRRLSEVGVQTAGTESLAPSPRSIYQGPALRCDFEGRLLAGFKRDDDRARSARAQQGSAWLAAASPGGPAVPVRVEFQTRYFGPVTLYLAP